MSAPYSDAPPPYDSAVAGGSSSSSATSRPSRLQPVARNGIPPDVRRSMEDEHRELPKGWIRQYDQKSQHQFFVDLNAKPPRSIWHHPYDDDQFLSTLPSEERERVQELYKAPSLADIAAEDTDDEDDHHHGQQQQSLGKTAAAGAAASHAASSSSQGKKKESLSQKMKDKLTGKTHEERVKEREERARQEKAAYERHLMLRQAMNRAMETGQPQLVGRDREGHDLYLEPPRAPGAGGYGMRPQGAYNPYAGNPAYSDPNARFLRPDYGYSRPMGPGYGGGYGYGYGGGMGLGMPLMGGLAGGMLLGGMMGGF